MFELLNTIRVYEDPFCMTGEEVRRTWKERLFTRPWRPWRKTKHISVPALFYVPRIGYVGHPEIIARMRDMCKTANENK